MQVRDPTALFAGLVDERVMSINLHTPLFRVLVDEDIGKGVLEQLEGEGVSWVEQQNDSEDEVTAEESGDGGDGGGLDDVGAID